MAFEALGNPCKRQLFTGKGLPNVSYILDRFRDAFDWSEADRNGRIIPLQGCDPEYDATCNAIQEIESSLKEYLKEQRKLLRCASVVLHLASFQALHHLIVSLPITNN